MKLLQLTNMALWLIFITLKLTGHIDWTWWWVHAPIWVPLLLSCVGFVIKIWALALETPEERKNRELREDMKRFVEFTSRKH